MCINKNITSANIATLTKKNKVTQVARLIIIIYE